MNSKVNIVNTHACTKATTTHQPYILNLFQESFVATASTSEATASSSLTVQTSGPSIVSGDAGSPLSPATQQQFIKELEDSLDDQLTAVAMETGDTNHQPGDDTTTVGLRETSGTTDNIKEPGENTDTTRTPRTDQDTGTTAHPRDADTVARIEDPSGGDVPQPGGQPPTGAVETGDTDQRSGDDPTEAGVRETSGTTGSIHESGDDTTTVRTKEDTGTTHPQDHTMPMLVETGGGDMLQPGSDTASKEEGMREDNQAPGSSPMEIPKAQLLNYFT